MEATPVLEMNKVVAIAPMLDITNIYFRYLVRLLTKRATLYTEMLPASAIIMST